MLNLRVDTLQLVGSEVVQLRFDLADGGTLVFGIPRLALLIDALAEWLDRRAAAGFLRHDEHVDLPLVDAVLPELRALHERAVGAAAPEPAFA